jgi:hypothetical protein
MRGMNNNHRRSNFTPSDDALIRQQPVTGISVQLLATMLRTNREAPGGRTRRFSGHQQ